MTCVLLMSYLNWHLLILISHNHKYTLTKKEKANEKKSYLCIPKCYIKINIKHNQRQKNISKQTILWLTRLKYKQHTGESIVYEAFKSSSLITFFPIPELGTVSVLESSDIFGCCCSSTFKWPTSVQYNNKHTFSF